MMNCYCSRKRWWPVLWYGFSWRCWCKSQKSLARIFGLLNTGYFE